MTGDVPADAVEAAANVNAAAVTASIAIQMEPIGRYQSGEPWTGDLQSFAEQLTGYLADNLAKFADPRGADVFLAVSVKHGDEQAGHEYRSGHYVKADAEGTVTDG